jgi:tripartite-type tricarboxylate transporter receptor subunit TctC
MPSRRTLLRRIGGAAVATALSCALTGRRATAQPAAAAWSPDRPVTFLGPFAAGGAIDVTARAIARGIEPLLGQPVAVVNRTGAGGTIMLNELARARPDGHTIGLLSVNTNAIAPQLLDVAFDPVKDFTPILTYGAFYTFVVVPSGSRFAGLRELMEQARREPGRLNVGVSAIGSNAHLTMARVAAHDRAEVTFVPFGGGAPAVTALLGGHVDCAVTAGEILPYVRDGRLRAIAVLNGERAEEFPQVPTLLDLGYGWAANPWLGVGGPKDLPGPVVARLAAAMNQAMEGEEFRRVMRELAILRLRLDSAESVRLMERSLAEHAEVARTLRIGRFAPR